MRLRVTYKKSVQRGMACVLMKLAFISFASGVFITTFHSAREKSQDMQGIRNLRQLGATAQLYAAANKDTLPPLEDREVARAALEPYLERGSDSYTSDPWEI